MYVCMYIRCTAILSVDKSLSSRNILYIHLWYIRKGHNRLVYINSGVSLFVHREQTHPYVHTVRTYVTTMLAFHFYEQLLPFYDLRTV